MATYTRNYLYIYVTQAISMLLGMFSLFIVIPYLSNNKEVYGIYAICSSLTLFYNYADIGFLGAGLKFASEAYIRKEKERELKIIGFSGLLFFLFLLIISILIMIIAYHPNFLIRDISADNTPIAKSLLLILALSSPIVCFQRLSHLLFSIRLSDYYFQLFQLFGSILKIASVFLFFGRGKYDIVGYYLSFQLISAFVVLVSFWFLDNRYNVGIRDLLRNFRLDKSTYYQLNDLAFATLFGTICWIIYYELDNIIIAELFGAKTVAIYAVAFSVLTIFRNIFGSFFSPYPTRFNYFVGLGDIKGLNMFAKTLMEFFMPICLIPIIIMSIVSEPFVFSWVGREYEESINVLSFLLFCNVLAFVSYPAGSYIVALKKNKHLYIVNGIIVVVYLLGVSVSYKGLGVTSFALMKAVGMILSAIYGFIVVFRTMKESMFVFVSRLMYVYCLPFLFCIIMSTFAKRYMMFEKGSTELLVNIFVIIFLGFGGYLTVLLVSSLHRNKFYQIVSVVKKIRKYESESVR